MGKRKIDLAKMGKMLLGGKSPRDCMKEFGCSEVAFYKAKKKLSRSVTESIVKVPRGPNPLDSQKEREKIGKGVQGQEETTRFNVIKQLEHINLYANEILDLMMAWNRGDETAIQVLESQITTKKIRVGDEERFIEEAKFKDPRELALKAMAEIRGQINLQFEISKQLYNISEIKKYQEIVIEIFGELDPDAKRKFIQRLREHRSLRGLTDLT